MIYYLTDNVIINESKMYDITNKMKQITKYNWHNLLNDYGWEKIYLPWIKQLNKLSVNKLKNCPYGMYDCPSDGNCFFHCIANALKEKDRYTENYYDQSDIRKLIAESITEEDFKILMSYYRIMKDANDFDEEWDPYQIDSIDDFKLKLIESGHSYWGDYLLLNLIIEKLRLNIMILNYDEDEKDYTIYNTLIEYNPEYDSIFLIYEDKCHFKLLGYFDNLMRSYFKNDNIPEELSKLFNLKNLKY